MLSTQTRRRFLATVSMAGGAVLLRATPVPAAEGTLETTTVRLLHKPTICGAPQYVAEELLRAEGFTDISYTKIASSAEVNDAIIHGRADFDVHFAPQWVSAIDGGGPISVLGGVHVGCFELFGNERVRRITDLKGKIVGEMTGLGVERPMFVSVMAANIGLDPVNDIRWIASQSPTPADCSRTARSARLGLPPVAQDLRARHAGQVVVEQRDGPPVVSNFLLHGGRQQMYGCGSIRSRPNGFYAAILKAADLCATAPESAARRLVDGGFTERYDYALQTLSELPYDKWREYDHEDTLRFYALRLHEAGMIKSEPRRRSSPTAPIGAS